MTVQQLPVIRGIVRRIKLIRAALELYIPPGHYYSPIISKIEVRQDAERIFEKQTELKGININYEVQKQYLEIFREYYTDFLRDYDTKNTTKTYTPDNGFYSYTDGIFLYGIIRHFKPSSIIEVGSGYSSALMYDVCHHYLNGNVTLNFIEPYPEERLLNIISGKNKNVEIIKSKVQQTEVSKFKDLNENDILFIDSSHVSKTGSDLNFLLFEVLPYLKKGVLIHFHDIYYPFEYPQSHVLGNRWFSWNEAYILRAFLTYNTAFEIIFWNSYLEKKDNDFLKEHFPKYFNGGSASIWLRKL